MNFLHMARRLRCAPEGQTDYLSSNASRQYGAVREPNFQSALRSHIRTANVQEVKSLTGGTFQGLFQCPPNQEPLRKQLSTTLAQPWHNPGSSLAQPRLWPCFGSPAVQTSYPKRFEYCGCELEIVFLNKEFLGSTILGPSPDVKAATIGLSCPLGSRAIRPVRQSKQQ